MSARWATWVVVAAGLLAVLSRGGPSVWAGGLVLDAVVTWSLVALLIFLRVTPSGEDGQRASLAISTLLLVASAAHAPSVALGAAWLLWLVALPIAAGAGGHGLATLRVALATAALAMPVFWLLPRPAGPDIPWSVAMAPGDLDAERDDPSVVATVRFPDTARPIVLRASGLTQFDGQRWTVDDTRHDPPSLVAGEGVTLQVHHAPLGGVVLVPPGVVSIADPSLWQDGAEAWHTRGDGPVDLTVTALQDAPLGPETLDASARARALALPDLDPRVVALARKVTSGAADAVAKVEAVTAEVSSRRYEHGASAAADPLAAFLLDDAGGDCELFASSVAVLLRLSDVPARVATGFTGGEVDGDHLTFLREGAHAWAEAHLDGVGWVPVDATAPAADSPPAPAPAPSTASAPSPPPEPWTQAARPPVGAPPTPATWRDPLDAWWRRWVLDWDRSRQQDALATLTSMLGALGAALSALAATVGFVGVLRWLRAWRTRRVTPARTGVAGAWDQALRALAAEGWVAPDELPPLDAARWLTRQLGAAAVPLERLAWLHVEVSFGGADESARLDEANDLAAQVQALAQTLGRGASA